MRAKQAIRAISLILIVSVLTVSCATMAENPALCTAAGAVLGAGFGAGLGALGGGKKGAVIGAGAGGVTGALLAAGYCFKAGPFASREVKGYEETRTATNYQPGQGDLVQITRYSLAPAAVSPGNTVTLNATYVVMAPDPNQEVPIVETRILKVLDTTTNGYKVLGQVETPVTVTPGTRQADGKFPVPSGTPTGQYVVVLEVTRGGGGKGDTKDLPLIVTTDQAVLQRSSSRVAEVVAELEKTGASNAPPTPSPRGAAPAQQGSPLSTGRAEAGAPSTTPGAEVPLAAIGEKDPKAPPQVASIPAPDREAAKVAIEKPRYFVASKVVSKGNVREGPGTRHKIIAEIMAKDRYLIMEEAKDRGGLWYKIRLDSGLEGWVAASLGIVEVEQ